MMSFANAREVGSIRWPLLRRRADFWPPQYGSSLKLRKLIVHNWLDQHAVDEARTH